MGSKLFKKYALIFSALVGFSLLASGLLGISFSYQENKQALIRLQREKAQSAAQRIAQYLTDLEQKMIATAEPESGGLALDQRKAEIQMLRRTPAFKVIRLLEPNGKEVLQVSRRTPDVVGSGRDFSDAKWFAEVKSGRPYRSQVYLLDGALYMTIAMTVGPPAAGITVAEVDLEFLLDGISRIKSGESGLAYVVDEQGHLIAHPDIGLVLKHTNMAVLPQVQTALRNRSETGLADVDGHDLEGRRVLTSFGLIPYLNWFVFVEQSLSEAYAPLVSQAVQSALLVLVGMVLTVLATVVLVRKMVSPIQALRDGAKRIGQGVFNQHIVLRTGDELEELGDEFNRMADQLHDSYTSLEQKVEQRTRALLQSEQRLREAQQIAGLGSYVFDLSANAWTSSDVLNTLLGIDENYQHTAQGWTALLHPEDRKLLVRYFNQDILGGGQTFDKVFRIIRQSDQAERWVHGLGKVSCDAQGRVRKVQGTIQDITERKQMEDQIRQLAFYDALTALPNRRLLSDRLGQCLIGSQRNGFFGALMFLDLDNFKQINDLHGHAAGDSLLVEVAVRLKACVRKADTVARFGGDEFVVMLCELDRDKAQSSILAQAVAEKIGSSLSEPYHLTLTAEGQQPTTIIHHGSASIGVFVFGDQTSDVNNILKNADVAMYQAKAAGRNTIRCA
ncbi:MAG TPA: diguanylate cyclase [Rhodoferax sp.]|nr:diguanylate cyclase [Rhodoferax sp.]